VTRAEPCRATRRMTRQYAAMKLLEHGPLRFPEFAAITGWPPSAAAAVLQHLRSQGLVASERVSARREAGTAVYRLTEYRRLTQGRGP
jgi:predicted ArsR family transcriptional regulator